MAEDRDRKFLPPGIEALLEKVPCRYEFFKHVQCFNLALEVGGYRNLTHNGVY